MNQDNELEKLREEKKILLEACQTALDLVNTIYVIYRCMSGRSTSINMEPVKKALEKAIKFAQSKETSC